MHAPIVKRDSQKHAAFNATLKDMRKQKPLSIVQTRDLKLRWQCMRARCTTKTRVRRHQFAGLRAYPSWKAYHALCGHRSERWIAGAPVDSNVLSTKTVSQYHGCHWTAVLGVIQTTATNFSATVRHEESCNNDAHRAWLPLHREMGMRSQENVELYLKTGKKNLPGRYSLRFWIISRQNSEKRGHNRTDVRKRLRADLGEHWRQAVAFPTYIWQQPQRADPQIHGRAGEARKEHSCRGKSRGHPRQ